MLSFMVIVMIIVKVMVLLLWLSASPFSLDSLMGLDASIVSSSTCVKICLFSFSVLLDVILASVPTVKTMAMMEVGIVHVGIGV